MLLSWRLSWKETSITDTTASFKQAIHHGCWCWAIYTVRASSTPDMRISAPRLHPMSCPKDKHVFHFLLQCNSFFLYCFLFFSTPSILSVVSGMSAKTVQCLLHHYWESNCNNNHNSMLVHRNCHSRPAVHGGGKGLHVTQSQGTETPFNANIR